MISDPVDLFRWAALAIPPLYVAAALAPPALRPFAHASRAAAAALFFAVLGALAVALSPATAGASGTLLDGLARLDAPGATMLLLVASITVVIVRYSRSYLDADPQAARYSRWLMVTVACVTVLVLSNNLLLMVLAWSATGMALHPLLTHFQERPAALVAAHKKFLVSRLADACLLAAVALVHHHTGTLQVDRLAQWFQPGMAVPAGIHVAGLLLVAGVCLKSAQLPFHGWLIQVMEAPTPVSALLHAGVVNIGGFVMIRLAAVMVHLPAAQWMLVAVGTASAVLAALVMTTRVSIKVALAWSTCAQMGFMLLQCGLGAYHLALLHLVAHSLYKAHAFLASGTTVETWRALDMLPRPPASSATRWGLAGLLGLMCGAVTVGFPGSATSAGNLTALWAVGLGLALAPLWLAAFHGGWRSMPGTLLAAGGMVALTQVWHAAAAALYPTLGVMDAPRGAAALVGGGFILLFVVNAWLQSRPDSALAQHLYHRLFSGLHLDERFTRLTFQLWPPRLPAPRPSNTTTATIHATEA